MPSKIDVTALTLNPEEETEANKMIFEQEFVHGVLSQNHSIETGIQWSKQIVFAGKYTDSLEALTACTAVEGGDLPLTEKFWTPQKYGTRFTHCADELDILLKIFGKAARINPDFYNMIDSEAGKFIMARLGMMLRETLPTKVWFSDTAADDIAGGGVFTNGTNIGLYDVINGLFQQIRAEIQAGDSNYVEITQNTGVKADQNLTGQEAFDYLVAMKNAADPRLIQTPEAKYYITRSIADPYRDFLRTSTSSNGFIDITEDGREVLKFDGRAIEIMYEWDRIITSDQDDVAGDTFFQPMRALLTTPDNIPVGTLNEADFDEVRAFYHEDSNQAKFDIKFNLDTKFLEDYMAVAAY